MSSPYLAHINAQGDAQTVLAHLTETAALSKAFAAAFDAEEQGYLTGLAHDIGKYSVEFQARLRGGSRGSRPPAEVADCIEYITR